MNDRQVHRRSRLALAGCAAVLALLASIVAAVGPARGERAEYSWPPATLPASTPTRGWYAPLPLLNRVPSSIEVRLPCGLAPPLRADRPGTVLATARHPQAESALRIALRGDALRIRVGWPEIASVPWPASCPLDLEVQDGELRLPSGVVKLHGATPGRMPVVTGLFSGLDLRAGEPPQVVIRTRVYATSQTGWQVTAAVLAIALAFAALLLLAQRDGRHPLQLSFQRRIESMWAARDSTDAVVLGVLLAWWIVAPTFTDDGWVWVEHRVLGDLGELNVYFDSWGLNSPIAYWIMWLGHWAIASTNDLVFMRLPSLLALLAAWPLCRWSLQRVVGGRPSTAVSWVLVGTFLVGATAWAMTLRLEPFISLLVLVSLAAMVSFALAPRLAPLAIAVPAVVLAVTAHPTGIVAAAPLLAASPRALRWVRSDWGPRLTGATVVLLVGLTLALVLFTLDADLATRLNDSRLARGGDLHGEPWWREYIRYARFDQYGGETAARRLSLAFLILAALAWGTRRRASRTGVLVLPASSVAIGLVMLAFVPSKWPWHFGTFVAIGAVAAAAEVARLIREPPEQERLRIRPIAALAAIGAVGIWSWSAQGEWSPLDLQETSWSTGFGFGNRQMIVIPILAAALAILVSRRLRIRQSADRVSAIIAWALPVISLAVVGVTGAMLAYDAATSPWSPTRQNLEALVGGESCGLAHQLSGEPGLVDRVADPSTPTLLVPSVGVYFPCATIPAIEAGLVQVPRLVAFQASAWPLYERDGPFAAVRDLYELRSIAQGPKGVEVLSVAEEVPGFVRVDAVRGDHSKELVRAARE